MRACERITFYKVYDARGVLVKEGSGRRKDFERFLSLVEAQVIRGRVVGELPLRIEEAVADVRA